MQHLRPKMDIRKALEISFFQDCTNTILYLADLESMLRDTRILPGDTIDMLISRVDLIFSAKSRLKRTASATNNDFALAMIHVTSHLSPIFDSTKLKIHQSSDSSMTRSKIIQMYITLLQYATRPQAQPPYAHHLKRSQTR